MKPNHPTVPQLSQVELALAAAIRLIANMDKSAHADKPIIVAELIVWVLKQTASPVIEPLVESGQLESLTGLLRHYAALRPIAESRRFSRYLQGCAEAGIDYYDDGYLTPADMRSALQSGDWKCSERAAYTAIARVLRYVIRRKEDALPPSDPKLNPDTIPIRNTLHGAKRESMGEVADELEAELQPSLATAVAHARRELLACDNGDVPNFWDKVYTSVVGDWLQTDKPEIAAHILANELTVDYFQSIWVYVSQMKWVERLWHDLGHAVRQLLRQESDEAYVLQLIAAVVGARKLSDDELEIAAWSKRVWHMVQRRDPRIKERTEDLILSAESNAVIDSIRGCTDEYDTCYLVDATALPTRFCDLTDEKQVLVARLPEPWLLAVSAMEAQTGLDCFFWETDKENYHLSLAISRTFWCRYDQLWPKLINFRRSLPVLYVFETCCVFARYRFQHFSDLRAVADVPHRRRMSLDISGENWEHDHAAFCRTTVLPDRSRLKPSILGNLVDRTRRTGGSELSEAYLRKNPEIALSREEHVIR